MSDDEVTYYYVKGQGWVPRLGPEPEPVKPAPSGWTGLVLDGDDGFYRRMREHQEEAERRMWVEAARQWARGVRVPVQAGPWGQTVGRTRRRNTDDLPATYTMNTVPPQDRYVVDNPAWETAPLRFTHDEVDGWTNLATGHGTRPAPANPEDIRETRYYPGANVAPEPVRQENQHERRAREYREELERARRRRGR